MPEETTRIIMVKGNVLLKFQSASGDASQVVPALWADIDGVRVG